MTEPKEDFATTIKRLQQTFPRLSHYYEAVGDNSQDLEWFNLEDYKKDLVKWLPDFVNLEKLYAQSQRDRNQQLQQKLNDLLEKHDITFAYHGCMAWLGELKSLFDEETQK